MKIIPCTTTPKKKNLENNLIKEVKDLYDENYFFIYFFLKEIKGDKYMETRSHSWTRKLVNIKMLILSKQSIDSV